MQVIIQNAQTRKYFSNDGQWASTPAEAQDFSLANVAYKFAERRGVKSFHVLFYYPETRYSIEILTKENDHSDYLGHVACAT
ncbi:MAG: hypothetical protein JWQ71_4551 [Pedosphaera sp.]|nr:hypothetical protein [Pedosphaera sp.]